MRKTFSSKNSILPNGELNHKYFQTKIGQYWTDEDNEKLSKGIEEFGVGAWDEIKAKYLKSWSQMDLKLRCGYLFKCVNIDKYSYISFTKEEIIKIANQNEREGIEKNKFKHGVYFN
jgi:hypothetical protein